VRYLAGANGKAWSYDEQESLGDPGATGQVLAGVDADGLLLAIKRVPLASESQGARRRQGREPEIFELLAGMQTAHVISVLDVIWNEDALYLVMPRAERSLAQAIRDGSLLPEQRVEAIRHVLLGLCELASAGVLHRDVKPANVLWLEDRWQLADFGISRDQSKSTDTYTFLGAGTWPYMAPELWGGATASQKTDLYAAGILAFEVLTGRRPFSGPQDSDFMDQHRVDPVPELVGESPPVQRLVNSLLEKNPGSRPQSAESALGMIEFTVGDAAGPTGALQRAALVAQQRQSVDNLKLTRNQEAERLRVGEREQALADLRHSMEAGYDIARLELEGVEFRTDGAQFHLIWGRTHVTVVLWQSVPGSLDAHTPVLAGMVTSSSLRGFPRGNVICDRQGVSLVWKFVEFTASAFVGSNYSFGPSTSPHGFSPTLFADQRPYMRLNVTHVWQMKQQPLTPRLWVDLLAEAIAST
jgi:serine/threonine protein kinase